MTHRRVGVRAAAAVAVLLASSLWTPVVTAAGGGATRASDHATTPLSAVAAPPSVQEAVADAPSDSGEWGPLLDWGVQAKHMIQLSTGKVLVWSTGDNARVWDPTTGTFTLAPATFGDLHCAGQSTLADGRVIVVGGQNGSPHNGHNITSLFDPISPDLDARCRHDRPALVRDEQRRWPTARSSRHPAMPRTARGRPSLRSMTR